jgi:hypothetical protein
MLSTLTNKSLDVFETVVNALEQYDHQFRAEQEEE